MGRPGVLERTCVEVQRRRQICDAVLRELRSLGIQSVVHWPKRSLARGPFGRLRGLLRVRVDVGQREVSKHESQARLPPRLQSDEDGKGLGALRTLEIAILKQRDWGIVSASYVIARPHRE